MAKAGSESFNFQMYKCYTQRFKLLITIGLYLLFVNYGIFAILPSLTLIDLVYLMDTSIITASFGITLGIVVCCFGCILCGLVFRVIDRRIGLIVAMAIKGFVTMLYPFLKSLTPFMVLMTFWGVLCAVVDVNGNAWILDLWGDQVNSYMQGLHFAFAVGMALGPIFLAPCMGLEPKNETNLTHPVIDDPLVSGLEKQFAKPLQTFQLAFVLIGVSMLVSALFQVVLYVLENRKIRALKPNLSNEVETKKCASATTDNFQPAKFVVIMGFFIILFQVGMEVNSIRFVTEYIHFLGYDVETAGHQATLMNSAYAVFRFIGIFLPRFMATDTMVLAHLSVVIVSALIMTFLTRLSLLCISIGLILFGCGCAPIYPAIYALVEERTHLSNFAVGMYIAAGLIPGMVYPAVMPFIMQEYPMAYVYNILGSIILVTIVVVILIKRVPKPVIN